MIIASNRDTELVPGFITCCSIDQVYGNHFLINDKIGSNGHFRSRCGFEVDGVLEILFDLIQGIVTIQIFHIGVQVAADVNSPPVLMGGIPVWIIEILYLIRIPSEAPKPASR